VDASAPAVAPALPTETPPDGKLKAAFGLRLTRTSFLPNFAVTSERTGYPTGRLNTFGRGTAKLCNSCPS
jgi:hypothetical protein